MHIFHVRCRISIDTIEREVKKLSADIRRLSSQLMHDTDNIALHFSGKYISTCPEHTSKYEQINTVTNLIAFEHKHVYCQSHNLHDQLDNKYTYSYS